MPDETADEFERHVAAGLRVESDRLVERFDAQSVARKAMDDEGRGPQRLAMVAGTIAVAALTTIVGVALLNSPKSPPGSVTQSAETATPSPLPVDPTTAKAQSLVDRFLSSRPGQAAAAAFVTTTYGSYAATLPDVAGISGTPSPSDSVLVVELEGFFPATHSCGFIMTACFDTGIMVAYDLNLGDTLDVTYEDDPGSRDRPSPQASVSERFGVLRQWGTPVALQLPK
jgi:hypothetical protein